MDAADQEWENRCDAVTGAISAIIQEHWHSHIGPLAWLSYADDTEDMVIDASDPGIPAGWVLLISVGSAVDMDDSSAPLRMIAPRGQNHHDGGSTLGRTRP